MTYCVPSVLWQRSRFHLQQNALAYVPLCGQSDEWFNSKIHFNMRTPNLQSPPNR